MVKIKGLEKQFDTYKSMLRNIDWERLVVTEGGKEEVGGEQEGGERKRSTVEYSTSGHHCSTDGRGTGEGRRNGIEVLEAGIERRRGRRGEVKTENPGVMHPPLKPQLGLRRIQSCLISGIRAAI